MESGSIYSARSSRRKTVLYPPEDKGFCGLKTHPITAQSSCRPQADNNSAIMKSFVGHSPSFNDSSQHQLSTRQLLPSPHPPKCPATSTLQPGLNLSGLPWSGKLGEAWGELSCKLEGCRGPSQSNKQGCQRRAELPGAWCWVWRPAEEETGLDLETDLRVT